MSSSPSPTSRHPRGRDSVKPWTRPAVHSPKRMVVAQGVQNCGERWKMLTSPGANFPPRRVFQNRKVLFNKNSEKIGEKEDGEALAGGPSCY